MTFEITGEPARRKRGSFWKRQFAGDRTEPQLVFDVVFGLLAPVLCFYFDPLVFKGGFVGQPLYPSYQLFTYAITALAVSVLAVSMLFDRRLGRWSRVVGGVLINGAVFSSVIGFAIFPYSLLGLMIAIGLLGFIPFLTAFVYLRAGWRTLKHEDQPADRSMIGGLLVGATLSLAIPALLSLYVSRSASQSIDAILHGNSQQAENAVGHLRWLPFVPQQNLEPLIDAYLVETDINRKEIIKHSYRVLAGEDIERRLAIFND
jgi:hypothetical protein